MPVRFVMRRLAAAIVLTGLALDVVAAAPDSTSLAAARRAGAAALDGRALDDTRDLTSTVGARVTGTPAYQRATEWARDALRTAGAANVRFETFTMPSGWQRGGPAAAAITAPVHEPLNVAAFGWSAPTPIGGIDADVVEIESAAAITAARVRGRIVVGPDDAPASFDRRAKAAGAVALIFVDPDPDGRLVARVREFGGRITDLPAATISSRDAARVHRLLERGAVRMTLTLPCVATSGPIVVRNVIGEIKGRERPDEWVIVGAHLDSWDFATGAQDNATGVAMVIESARAIAAAGRPPRRTIRFALWGGEEQGLLGSSAYVEAHAHEIGRAVAALNADAGTGRMIGWTTPGQTRVAAAITVLSREILSDLHADAVDQSMRYAFDSDGGPFLKAGVPMLDQNADDSRYEDVHHRATDALDRVDARNLSVGAAMVAATAYAVADDGRSLRMAK